MAIDLYRECTEIARIQAAAASGRWNTIEPAGDATNPLSPDYSDPHEARLEALEEEIWADDNDAAAVGWEDATCGELMKQILIAHHRRREPGEQLRRDMNRAWIDAVKAEARERLEREKKAPARY